MFMVLVDVDGLVTSEVTRMRLLARHVEQQRPLRERAAARHGVAGAGAPGRDVQRRLDEAAQPRQLNNALAGDLVLRLVDGRDLADRVCMGTTGTRT